MKSILDNDLYNFTMQSAILKKYPNSKVLYKFINRGEQRFNKLFLESLKEKINKISELCIDYDEISYLKDKCKFLPKSYINYLENLPYDAESIKRIELTEDNNLCIDINDYWHKSILWETPLLAAISETYFEEVDKNWNKEKQVLQQRDNIRNKKEYLSKIQFADFGTRRRRNYITHDAVIEYCKSNIPTFLGTSNVHFAHKHTVKPIGTMSHQWIMAHSALQSLRHANKYALQNWAEVYNGELGIALTDTYGSKAFYDDFDGNLSRLFDGVRHDSGCPFKFTDLTVKHYNDLRINPLTKTIIFSDGLNPKLAYEISEYCKDKIKCSFGIGTNLTNDFKNSNPLNIVIKLWSVDNIPVVKLSDVPTKATGDRDAIRVARWTLDNIPLDNI
jgi:nicotinate phosphoribosyltransferase